MSSTGQATHNCTRCGQATPCLLMLYQRSTPRDMLEGVGPRAGCQERLGKRLEWAGETGRRDDCSLQLGGQRGRFSNRAPLTLAFPLRLRCQVWPVAEPASVHPKAAAMHKPAMHWEGVGGFPALSLSHAHSGASHSTTVGRLARADGTLEPEQSGLHVAPWPIRSCHKRAEVPVVGLTDYPYCNLAEADHVMALDQHNDGHGPSFGVQAQTMGTQTTVSMVWAPNSDSS